MKKQKRTGILSLYYHNWNFGGMLQSYALNRSITSLGYSVEHVLLNRESMTAQGRSPKAGLLALLRRQPAIKDLLDRRRAWHWGDRRDLRSFRHFEAKGVPHGRKIYDVQTAWRLNQGYDCFVAGSDQIWNPLLQRDDVLSMFGLTFAERQKRCISYAASIGSERSAVGKEDLFREILGGLNAISVREKTAQAFLQPLTDKPIAVVLDPTLLLTRGEWAALAAAPEEPAPYLFGYFLIEASNRHHREFLRAADELGLPVRCIADEPERYLRPGNGDRQIWDAGPKEFVGYIRDAELVLTNSFHGTVFSVLFHKPFWVFKRNKDDAVGSMNARITDFLAEFGLESRLLEDGEFPSVEKLAQPIEWTGVEHVLEEKRSFSLNWLKEALMG